MASLSEAAFRTGPFEIELNGHRLVFPHLTADRWTTAMFSGDLSVVQLMTPEQFDLLLDLIEDESLSVEDVHRVARKAVAEAAGRPWWEAERLVASVFEPTGRILGNLMLSGVRPETMTLAAWCAAVWALITRNADGTDLMKAEMQLSVPPAEADEDDLAQDDFEAAVRRAQGAPGVRVG